MITSDHLALAASDAIAMAELIHEHVEAAPDRAEHLDGALGIAIPPDDEELYRQVMQFPGGLTTHNYATFLCGLTRGVQAARLAGEDHDESEEA